MKKTLIMVAVAFVGTNVFAQDLTSKKGEPILPEAGDWAIGIDANPFLNYAGNFFGKTTSNSAPSFNFLNGVQVITGKYFKEAQTAYRGSLRIGLISETNRQMVSDRSVVSNTTYPLPVATVENEWKQSTTAVGLSAGIEKRKGKTRLQGFYGGEVGVYMQSTKDKFTYGNKLNPDPAAPQPVYVSVIDDQFGGANNTSLTPPIQAVDATGARVVERKNGTSFSLGVRGFVGVEYFILPKISLGGEFGWGIGVGMNGKSTTTYESTGSVGTTPTALQTEIEGAKQGSFKIDTDNISSMWGPSGSIRLNFHF